MVTPEHGESDVNALLDGLRVLDRETECLEFKSNDANPFEIGEYISAMSNSAALLEKPRAYVVWGVEDRTGRVVGTAFDPYASKQGNENLENWLTRLLEPQIAFRFVTGLHVGIRIVVLEIDAARSQPTRFRGEEYVRVGSYKKKLKDHPEKERALWQRLGAAAFEDGIAATRLTAEATLELLDSPSYFALLQAPTPTDRDRMLATLEADRLVHRSGTDRWDITNLGAVLFARSLARFRGLRRKSVRIIQYAGRGRLVTTREREVETGYASGFEALVRDVMASLPSNEVIEQALRKSVPMFPPLAVREVVANALIHQDFSITGTGPVIEVFDDRMEITNPGRPLVPTDRFLDQPPRSRNECLAALTRRLGICEERGSGIDKLVFQIEVFQLPAPLFETTGEATRVTLFGHRLLKDMERADRLRACYLHACLRYVMHQPMTNASLRERFGIEERNAATASNLLNEAVEAGVIVLQDPNAGYRLRRYLPAWAAPASSAGSVV